MCVEVNFVFVLLYLKIQTSNIAHVYITQKETIGYIYTIFKKNKFIYLN